MFPVCVSAQLIKASSQTCATAAQLHSDIKLSLTFNSMAPKSLWSNVRVSLLLLVFCLTSHYSPAVSLLCQMQSLLWNNKKRSVFLCRTCDIISSENDHIFILMIISVYLGIWLDLGSKLMFRCFSQGIKLASRESRTWSVVMPLKHAKPPECSFKSNKRRIYYDDPECFFSQLSGVWS